MPDYALAIALLVVVLALVGVLLTPGEHRVDQPSQLVGSRGDGLWLVHPRAHSAEVGAQGRVAAAQCGRRQSQGLSGAVDTTRGLAAPYFAACDLGARAQAQPTGEVLDRGEA